MISAGPAGAGAIRSSTGARPAIAGSRTVKVAPCPRPLLTTVTSPPWNRASRCTSVSPMPCFLVPGPDYWKDRIAALVVLDKARREVEQDIELIPKPWDKMWQNRELVVKQLNSGTAIERFASRRPDVAEGLLARFRPPTIQRERP